MCVYAWKWHVNATHLKLIIDFCAILISKIWQQLKNCLQMTTTYLHMLYILFVGTWNKHKKTGGFFHRTCEASETVYVLRAVNWLVWALLKISIVILVRRKPSAWFLTIRIRIFPSKVTAIHDMNDCFDCLVASAVCRRRHEICRISQHIDLNNLQLTESHQLRKQVLINSAKA